MATPREGRPLIINVSAAKNVLKTRIGSVRKNYRKPKTVINDDVRPSQVEGPEPSVPVVNAFGSSQDGAASQQNADKAITQQDIFSQLNSTQQSPVFPFGPVFNQVRQLPGN